MHPHAALPVHPVVVRGAGDDVDLVPGGGQPGGDGVGVPADAAHPVRRVLLGDEADDEPPLTPDQLNDQLFASAVATFREVEDSWKQASLGAHPPIQLPQKIPLVQ